MPSVFCPLQLSYLGMSMIGNQQRRDSYSHIYPYANHNTCGLELRTTTLGFFYCQWWLNSPACPWGTPGQCWCCWGSAASAAPGRAPWEASLHWAPPAKPAASPRHGGHQSGSQPRTRGHQKVIKRSAMSQVRSGQQYFIRSSIRLST